MKLRELLNQLTSIAKEHKISTPWIVGGCARDRYLGHLKDISDLDITTGDFSIEYLVSELSVFLGEHYNFKLRKKPTGYFELSLGNLQIDFSSHFVIPNIEKILLEQKGIKTPSNLEKESWSRDFTINTLLLDLNLTSYRDITKQAIPDLNAKIIRTCLPPEITFTTNKNRVIRAIYLSAKLNFDIDPEIIEYVSANPKSIQFASYHTLAEKLDKALSYNPEKTISLISQMGLWNYVPITKALSPYYQQRSK
jgi:tRNA nucleotidyltransferase/poly(A) polymerase